MKYQLRIVDKHENQLCLEDKHNYEVPKSCPKNMMDELKELGEKVEIELTTHYATLESKMENIFQPIIELCNLMMQDLVDRGIAKRVEPSAIERRADLDDASL